MRILICDDEEQYANAVLQSIERWKSGDHNRIVSTELYTSSEDMLEALQKQVVYDLAFLDIQFPRELNGLQVAQELRKINEQMVIVFISNYEEYAVDGYRVNALRYFYKPITDKQVFECLEIAYHQWLLSSTDSFVVVGGKQQIYKLPYKSIFYIESMGHYLAIHTASVDCSTVSIRQKMDELLQKLPQELFVQCQKSFVVNLQYVQRITRATVTLANGAEIPVSPRYKENLFSKFRNLFQGDES